MENKKSKIDWKLANQIKKSLEDIKNGRITEWKLSNKINLSKKELKDAHKIIKKYKKLFTAIGRL